MRESSWWVTIWYAACFTNNSVLEKSVLEKQFVMTSGTATRAMLRGVFA